MVLEAAWAILGYIFYPLIWIVTTAASVVGFLFKLGLLLVICVAPAVYCFPGFRYLVIDFWVAVAGSSFLAYRYFCRREEREAADFRQRVREYRIRRRHSDTASYKSGGSLASGRSALSLSDRVPQQILPPALRGYSGWLLKLGKSYRGTPLVPWLSESTAWTLRFANFVVNDYLSSGIQRSASSGLALLDEADGDTEGEQHNGLEVVSEEEEEGGIEEELEEEEEEELRRGLQGSATSATARRPFLEVGQQGGGGGDQDIRLRIAAAGSSDPSPRQVIRAEQQALYAGGETRSRDRPSAGTPPGGRSSSGLPLSEHSSHRSRRSGAAKHRSIGDTDSRRRLSSGQSLQSLPAGRGPLSPQPGGLPSQQHLHPLDTRSPLGTGAPLAGSTRGSPRLIPTDSAPGDHYRGSGRDSLASIDLGLLAQARRDTAESIESGIGSGHSNGGALTPLSPLGGGGPIEAGISWHRRQVSAGASSLSSFPATPRVEQQQQQQQTAREPTRGHHSNHHPRQRRQSSTGAYIAYDHPDFRSAQGLGARKASGGITSGHTHGHEHSPGKRSHRHRPPPSISNGHSSLSQALDRAPDSGTPLAHSREASHAAHSDDSSGDEDHSKHAGFWQQEQEQSSRARTSIGSTGSKEFVKKLHSSIHGGSSKARSRSHHRGH